VGLLMSLWLPNGKDYRAYKVDRAVREHDERLMFARNPDTNDWCIFIRMPGDRDPFPVIGFQNTIPEPHEAIAKLNAGDTRKHGDRLLLEARRADEERRKALDYVSEQAASESVEHVEHLMRKHGKSPIIKSVRKVVGTNDGND
jgi:hypothetical protein